MDSSYEGVRRFVIPPPMAGFIEFALMRTRGDIDQKYLAELYYQYMNVEEDFVKDLFYATETKLGRVYVQEPVLTNEHMNHILDYERATHIIEEAKYIGLGLCYCRHKAYHAGHPCEIDAPWDVCLTFGNVARSLAEHGQHARLISKEEAKDVLERSYAANLVPSMIEMGIDIWQGVMSTNNIPELIKEYGGQITFMGGIDSGKVDKPDWTRENIAKVVEAACQANGTKYYIPCNTMGGPESIYPGVYETISEEIAKVSDRIFK